MVIWSKCSGVSEKSLTLQDWHICALEQGSVQIQYIVEDLKICFWNVVVVLDESVNGP